MTFPIFEKREMDRLKELELLVQVAETGSMGRAAQALGLSNRRPAWANSAALETRLNARLVERNTRRLYLTSEGVIFMSAPAASWPSCRRRNQRSTPQPSTRQACCASALPCRLPCSRSLRTFANTGSSIPTCGSTSRQPTATLT